MRACSIRWCWRCGEHTTDSMVRDDQLRLLFTCCHPALSDRGAHSLALRTLVRYDHRRDRSCVPGAGSDDGAAHQPREEEDRDARIPYRVPADHELPDRCRRCWR
jgi:RNA polymerase sigma-70 factor (ECF subfamily)